MPNYVSGNTYREGDEFVTHLGTNHDLRHRVGQTIWWTNHAGTISRFNPMEEPDLRPLQDKWLEKPLRAGRGLTYIIRGI